MSKKFIFDVGSNVLAKAVADAEDRLLIKLPDQDKCDHGVVFDEAAALKLLEETPVDPTIDDPALAFIMGSPASSVIKKRWPRLCGVCPKGCGYNGIAYASYAHYIYGDW
jgi:hypothetical protein